MTLQQVFNEHWQILAGIKAHDEWLALERSRREAAKLGLTLKEYYAKVSRETQQKANPDHSGTAHSASSE